MNRRVLIVAPAFPPHPSPATHRARFVARYAAEFGWEAEVAAVHPKYYDDVLDHELTRLLPKGLRISYASAFPARMTRRLGVGDLGLRAYIPLRRLVRRICRERPPDVLFIPGWPFYTFRIGAHIAAEYGIPYVLDYTDPWVFETNPGIDTPWKKAYWAHRLALLAEPRAVLNASHILAVSDGTNESVRSRFPEIPTERFSAVPFGFERLDFDAACERGRHHQYWDATDGNVHALYMGVVPPDAGETLQALLEAVGVLRAEAGPEGDRLRLHFVGTSYDPRAEQGAVMPLAQSMGLGDVVTEHIRRIPYVDALSVLATADLILGVGTTVRHYTASKIFPCILAGRPMLSMYHEASTVCDIVREARAGALITYSDTVRVGKRVSEIVAALRAAVRGEQLDPGPRDMTALVRYSAREACRHIFETFDRVSATAPSRATDPPLEALAHA